MKERGCIQISAIAFAFIFLISFVSAQQHDVGFRAQGTISFGDSVVKSLSSTARDLTSDNAIEKFANSTLFQRILIFMLVALILYAVIPFIPFIGENRNWVSVSISLIVALLATLYLNPFEITGVLYPYKALGLVIVGILPFCAAAVIAKRLHEREYSYLSKLLWVAFAVIIGAMVWNAPSSPNYYWVGWVYLAIFALSIFMIFAENFIWFKVFKQAAKGEASTYGIKQLYRINARLRENLGAQLGARGAELEALRTEEGELREKLRRG